MIHLQHTVTRDSKHSMMLALKAMQQEAENAVEDMVRASSPDSRFTNIDKELIRQYLEKAKDRIAVMERELSQI